MKKNKEKTVVTSVTVFIIAILAGVSLHNILDIKKETINNKINPINLKAEDITINNEILSFKISSDIKEY